MSHLWVPTGAGEAVVSLADALAAERHAHRETRGELATARRSNLALGAYAEALAAERRERRIAQAELAASQRAHRALCESLRRTAAAAGSDPEACVRLVALWASELPEAFR